MEKAQLNTPILFIIYNRPDLTFKVFSEIRKARPERLYIAADGPKNSNKDEMGLCLQARSVINRIDWDCTVKTKFQNRNIGCKYNVSKAIDWFFENEEEGIILEDDCLPNQSFFSYCNLLLSKYRNDTTVGHISGTNLLNGSSNTDTYFFSKYPFIWGWATWRRAWKHYDVTVETFPDTLINDSMSHYFNSNSEKYTFYNKFYQVYNDKIDTWDYQWLYASWKNNFKSIIPPVSLVYNIGFDSRATHTSHQKKATNIPSHSITEIIHPKSPEINRYADAYFYNNLFKRNFISNIFLYIRLNYFKLKNYGRLLKEDSSHTVIPVSDK